MAKNNYYKVGLLDSKKSSTFFTLKNKVLEKIKKTMLCDNFILENRINKYASIIIALELMSAITNNQEEEKLDTRFNRIIELMDKKSILTSSTKSLIESIKNLLKKDTEKKYITYCKMSSNKSKFLLLEEKGLVSEFEKNDLYNNFSKKDFEGTFIKNKAVFLDLSETNQKESNFFSFYDVLEFQKKISKLIENNHKIKIVLPRHIDKRERTKFKALFKEKNIKVKIGAMIEEKNDLYLYYDDVNIDFLLLDFEKLLKENKEKEIIKEINDLNKEVNKKNFVIVNKTDNLISFKTVF